MRMAQLLAACLLLGPAGLLGAAEPAGRDGAGDYLDRMADESFDLSRIADQTRSPGRDTDRFDPLEADRPDFTEQPRTVGRGRLQLESGWTYYHDRADETVIDLHELPELMLRYGLTDELEFRLTWGGYASCCERRTASGQTRWFEGYADMDIGCRLEVTQQEGWRPDSAVTLSVSAPVGSPEWTSGQTDPFIDYIYGWDLTEQISLTGSTGAWWTKFESDHYVIMHQSLTLGLGLTERLGSFFEWYVLPCTGGEDNRPSHFLDTGLTYLVTEDFQLDWRIGMGLSEPAADVFTGVGFAVRR